MFSKMNTLMRLKPIAKSQLAHRSTLEACKKFYPVTYLMALVGGGCLAMIGYSAYCVMYAPENHILHWDKESRQEHYKKNPYNPTWRRNADPRKPPVIMNSKGQLEFLEEGKY